MSSGPHAQCTIWLDEHKDAVQVIDQRLLPHTCCVVKVNSFEAMCAAIQNMTVRGAGLIGVSAAFGMWLATREASELQSATFARFMVQAAQTYGYPAYSRESGMGRYAGGQAHGIRP